MTRNKMTRTRKQKWERKQLYGRFKRQINTISHDKNWTWLRKGNIQRETESLVGKVIHWEMCRKFKFDHTKKWYMHNPAPVLENDTHELLSFFDILIDHVISARRPDLIIINKKKRICKFVDIAVPADHRIKLKECEKKKKYLDFAREL